MSQDNESPAKPSAAQRMWGDVRNEPTGVVLDGIEGFDNPIPAWWKAIFIATVALAFPYLAFYHGSAEGRTSADLHSAAAAANARLAFAEIGELGSDEATMVKYSQDKRWLALGKSIFQSNCAACHGRDGGGKIGPNLCDDQYKNVTEISDLYTVVSNGAAAGAMPPWKARMEQNELVLVACYVASLRGTTPASEKAAEGREIPAWPKAAE